MLFMKVVLPIFPAAAFFSAASKSELPGYDFFLHQRPKSKPGLERRKSVCCVVQYVIDRFPQTVEDWVENIGVEPMTSCMPCKRSSQLS